MRLATAHIGPATLRRERASSQRSGMTPVDSGSIGARDCGPRVSLALDGLCDERCAGPEPRGRCPGERGGGPVPVARQASNGAAVCAGARHSVHHSGVFVMNEVLAPEERPKRRAGSQLHVRRRRALLIWPARTAVALRGSVKLAVLPSIARVCETGRAAPGKRKWHVFLVVDSLKPIL